MVACPICGGKGFRTYHKTLKKCFLCEGCGKVTPKIAATAHRWKVLKYLKTTKP